MGEWKIGVSSYSFSRLVKSKAMRQIDVVPKAKEMGFDLIEMSTFILEEGETRENFAEKVRDECARNGIRIGNYTIGADFINGSGGDLKAEIERVKGEVRVAAIMGSPGMRHDGTSGFAAQVRRKRTFDDALPRLVEGCREITLYAEQQGIRTMVENHGRFCQDSERVEKLINSVNCENFGVLIDMGNFLCVDEDPSLAVARLAPYAFHVHAKDFIYKSGMMPSPGEGWFETRNGNYLRGTVIGHGIVPVMQCLRLLKKAGYTGDLSIEFEGMEEPEKGIRAGFENLKRYAAMA